MMINRNFWDRLKSHNVLSVVSMYLPSTIPSSFILSTLQTKSFLFNITVQNTVPADSMTMSILPEFS